MAQNINHLYLCIVIGIIDMIEYKTGDILKEDSEAIVNTVNCVGVMGRGIALQFKKAHPDNFQAYARACKEKKVVPGKMFTYKKEALLKSQYIINFPTKRHWRGKSRIEDIESGLADLVSVIEKYDIKTIAIPPLGSGLGGLHWEKVKELLERELSNLSDVKVVIFEPKGAPSAENMVKGKEVPPMTPGRAALVVLLKQYLNGLLDPFVSLIEVHKLMYFLQEAGESLNLTYNKATYGPYAENLRHVLHKIEGHFTFGYADGGDDPNKEIKIVPGAYEEANEFLQSKEHTKKRFDKVASLVDGFESPFGLELLSSAHWLIVKEGAENRTDVVTNIHNWNTHKQQFTERQINIAIDCLVDKGWVPEMAS